MGDYRRVALYGVDYLIEHKKRDKDFIDGDMTPDKVRDREELSEQIKALAALKEMAALYGFDILSPRRRQRKPFSGCTSAISPR